MAKQLERDLGLASVIAISVGAMVGSGIFILPGLAVGMAGPAVVLAYALAGLLVLPAALSKSEMATAMPEAGGTYIYIERGMGPILGTIAGVGTWFSLTFKGALALVGGAPYLVYYLDLPVVPVAVALAVVLIAINLVGAKQTGRLQIGMVVVLLAALAWFVGGGTPAIETVRFDGFFAEGATGVIAATGFVFVSYAGVTKVASVAEEIENPDRNIPLGILGSLFVTTLLYVAIVAVMVGTVPAPDLAGSAVPMVLAAESVLADPGVVAVIVAAILALISTANAGILSSSRYPFAMSRDDLAPATFEQVSERFGTPTSAITVTGLVLLALVVFVPIESIAKLASAFQILVFMLVNVAVVAFREGVAEYDPAFRSPLYPVPQAIGVLGGLVLLPFMGLLPLAGAVVIVLASLGWYYAFVYRRGGVDREGAAADVIRRSVNRRAASKAEAAVESRSEADVLVAIDESTPLSVEAALIDAGEALAAASDGDLRVVRFDEVPDQTPLEGPATRRTVADQAFEDRMIERAASSQVPLTYEEVVSHDAKHAIVNHARNADVETVVIQRRKESLSRRLLPSDVAWIEAHAPATVVEVDGFDPGTSGTITVVADAGPVDPEKVQVADALASQSEATLEFVYRLDADASDTQRDSIREYLADLRTAVSAPISTRVLPESDPGIAVQTVSGSSDVVVVDGQSHSLTGVSADGVAANARNVDGDAIVVHAGEGRGPIRRLFERVLF